MLLKPNDKIQLWVYTTTEAKQSSQTKAFTEVFVIMSYLET